MRSSNLCPSFRSAIRFSSFSCRARSCTSSMAANSAAKMFRACCSTSLSLSAMRAATSVLPAASSWALAFSIICTRVRGSAEVMSTSGAVEGMVSSSLTLSLLSTIDSLDETASISLSSKAPSSSNLLCSAIISRTLRSSSWGSDDWIPPGSLPPSAIFQLTISASACVLLYSPRSSARASSASRSMASWRASSRALYSALS
mmetsp:Transcript_26624/g.76859  ORF Transcript_26624/g.76859 Transcript_26624/m.76859 type:complete len:202 (+) Transcript_26624:1077-1682(+)